MVVIRLSRGGAKKSPFYQVVVADKRCRRDGRYIERVGYYNPAARGPEMLLNIDMDRINHWLATGAQPSERVSKLLKDYANAGGNISAQKESIATSAAAAKAKAGATAPAAKKKAAPKKAKEAVAAEESKAEEANTSESSASEE